ncbi:MAG TPA: hypothetical protein VFZ70_17150 [Euzebyales bacterium]
MAVTPNEGERQRTDVAVAIAAGAGAWEATQELRGVPGVRVVTTPRHAAVLLVAGTIDDEDREPLQRVHDQLPHPRAVVAWRPAGAARDVPAQVVDEDLDAVIAQVHRSRSVVIAEPARGARDLLPDTEPNAWRGVGPFGQGGEGMMGGTPYGRPMTMTGDDRDGLALDQLDLVLGPFLDPLPGPVTLHVTLQGDVLQDAELTVRRARDEWFGEPADPDLRTARRLLRRTAHGLHVAGLDALASRAAALARTVTDDADRAPLARATAGLCRRVRRSGLLWTLRGVGTIDGGDAAQRWRHRIATLTAAIDGSVSGAAPSAEPSAVEAAVVGMTLTDAMATLASVDALQPDAVGVQT